MQAKEELMSETERNFRCMEKLKDFTEHRLPKIIESINNEPPYKSDFAKGLKEGQKGGFELAQKWLKEIFEQYGLLS